MLVYSRRQQALYTVLLFVLLLLLVPRAGYVDDVSFWVRWARYSFRHGLGNVYQVPDNNYNPLYHYILWLYGQLAGSVGRIYLYRHWLKGFTLVFDFAGAFWAASLVRPRERQFGLALLLLLNFAYLYNTLVWEQVDAIYTCFAFGAVALAGRGRTVGSLLCFVLALLTKTQAVIFLPPLLLLWAPQWARRPAQLVRSLGAGAALAGLVLAPFVWGGEQNSLPRILEINRQATQMYPFVSMNAYNFWSLVQPDATGVPDSLPFAGLTYRGWGLLLFGSFSALALLPLLLAGLARWLHPSAPAAASAPTPGRAVAPAGAGALAAEGGPDLALVLLSCGLIPLLFAFFNTQMHERYWHPALLFLAAYAFLRRDYLLYGLVSVAYFLNLEDLLHHLRPFRHNSIFFKSWFAASLFALAIVLGLVKLYRQVPWRADWRRIWAGP